MNHWLFNDKANSNDQTFHICHSFMSYWVYLFSGRPMERAMWILGRTSAGDVSDYQSWGHTRKRRRHQLKWCMIYDFSEPWFFVIKLSLTFATGFCCFCIREHSICVLIFFRIALLALLFLSSFCTCVFCEALQFERTLLLSVIFLKLFSLTTY